MHHSHLGLLRDNASMVLLIRRLLDPAVVVLLLAFFEQTYGQGFYLPHVILLAVTTFLLMLPIFKGVGLYRPYRSLSPGILAPRLVTAWSILLGILLLLGFVTQTSQVFSRLLLMTWAVSVPPILLVFHLFVWKLLRQLRAKGHNSRSAVIAGVNDVSAHLTEQIQKSSELGINLHGFFDHAPAQDVDQTVCKGKLLGDLTDLPQYVQEHRIDVVYIACSMDDEETVTQLIRALQDTTACVYYVPNILAFNLMNAQSYKLNGVPLIAVWEIPFSELEYFFKRTTDIVFSLLALLILSPVMLAIAVAVKFSSPGPILFKQSRYGLNGQEIKVYKFRSMKVIENCDKVTQAKRNDKRVTKVGAFLRKTSLDELPQFINVLQGKMSIVGPRPHAVAHNEMYRKVITGYMLRHKVKPGITGWAQVNGYRGETDTIEKMQQRVKYDLEYLRNWSLGLDIRIILNTALVFLRDQNAY